jgi:8-oxo-dGTP diphosphatase
MELFHAVGGYETMSNTKPTVEYVVGFLFAPTRDQPDQVALIKKARPAWQAGKLNGIGGHVEKTDTSLNEAMRREFFEEAGADIPSERWEHFATILFDNIDTIAKVHFFKSFQQTTIISKTDEKVAWYEVNPIQVFGGGTPFVAHLQFLIPLALEDHLVNRQIRMEGRDA